MDPLKGDPEDALEVMSIPPMGTGALSVTPFGGKVEVMLRLAGLEYRAVKGDPGNKKLTPKGKFPVLRHGNNIVPDSSAIFEYLKSTYPSEMSVFSPPDAKMSTSTSAVAHSVQRMLEEHLYFAAVYSLWQRDEVAREYVPRILAPLLPLPAFLLPLATAMFRSAFARTLHGQGMGRHSLEEVRERLARDLDACSALLQQSGAYLSGTTPCQADCFLFAALHLAHTAYGDLPHQPMFATLLLERQVLVEFYQRMWPRVFAGASAGVADSRWDTDAGRKDVPQAPAPRSSTRLMLVMAAGSLAVGVGVWSAWRR